MSRGGDESRSAGKSTPFEGTAKVTDKGGLTPRIIQLHICERGRNRNRVWLTTFQSSLVEIAYGDCKDSRAIWANVNQPSFDIGNRANNKRVSRRGSVWIQHRVRAGQGYIVPDILRGLLFRQIKYPGILERRHRRHSLQFRFERRLFTL